MGEVERSCIVTRRTLPKEALLRFVLSPEGLLVADLNGKLPGRGIYTEVSKLIVSEALTKRAFNKAAGAPVTIPEGFLDRLQAQLERRVAESLSLARKAGQVVTGFEKVEHELQQGTVAALIHAADASDDGVRKLRQHDLPTFQELPRAVLSEVLGRENAVHVAVLNGPAASFFVESARRFALFLA